MQRALCAGERAQLETIDCGAAQCAGERAKLDAVDCVAGRRRGCAPYALRRRAGLARRCRIGVDCVAGAVRRAPPAGEWTQPEHSDSARVRSHLSRACSYSRVSLGALQCCLALTLRAHSRSARARSKAHSVHDGLALSRPSCIAPITKHNLVCDALHHLNFEMAALKTYCYLCWLEVRTHKRWLPL